MQTEASGPGAPHAPECTCTICQRAHRQAWFTALEDGSYTQHRGALCNDKHSAFCCLGVATDLYIKATGIGKWTPNNNAFRIGSRTEPAQVLPDIVREWLGMCSRDPVVHDEGEAFNVSQLNDGDDHKGMSPQSFSAIARFLREEYAT